MSLLDRHEELIPPRQVCDSLVHELDYLVFASEMWQRVFLFASLKILDCGETGDLEVVPHRLVHGGIHCCQDSWTLWGGGKSCVNSLLTQ